MPAPIGSSGAAGPAAIHDPPIEVLWLIKGLGPGGAEHLLVSTARAADRGRFRFTVAYLLDWKDALVAPLEAEEVAVRCLGVTDARPAVGLAPPPGSSASAPSTSSTCTRPSSRRSRGSCC